MKIETLIAKIQTDATHGQGTVPKEIMEAVTGLVSRLEGMLPNVETAREVATKLGVDWGKEPNDPVLAWAWTVWPLYHAGRMGELMPALETLRDPLRATAEERREEVRAAGRDDSRARPIDVRNWP